MPTSALDRRRNEELAPSTDDRCCPKCGQAPHSLTDLNECLWWRYASQWGDPQRAINAISELVGQGGVNGAND
jgi:hypothetical protein